MKFFIVLFFLINSSLSHCQADQIEAALLEVINGEIFVSEGSVFEGKLMIHKGLDRIDLVLKNGVFEDINEWQVQMIHAESYRVIVEVASIIDSAQSLEWIVISRNSFTRCEKLFSDEDYLIRVNANRRGLKHACINQAKRLDSVGNFSQANKHFLLGLKLSEDLDEKNPEAFFLVGESFSKMNNFEEAEKYYLKSLELNSFYFDANLKLGMQKFDEAALIYRVMEMSKSSSPGHDKPLDLPAGISDEKYKQVLNESRMYLEKAHQVDPRDLSIFNTLLSVFSRLEMTKEYADLKAEFNNLPR